MLTLVRKSGERVRIKHPSGTTIWLLVDYITAEGSVALSFDAPAPVAIDREEVAKAKDRQQLQGSRSQ
jgi:sRNA-binding carbon storage regulator CsrA